MRILKNLFFVIFTITLLSGGDIKLSKRNLEKIVYKIWLNEGMGKKRY